MYISQYLMFNERNVDITVPETLQNEAFQL